MKTRIIITISKDNLNENHLHLALYLNTINNKLLLIKVCQMKLTKLSVSSGLLSAVLTLNVSASVLEKPKTMEDMWKIIQAQQKQIDELKAGKQTNTATETTTPAPSPTTVAKAPAPATDDVKKLERKTDVLSQEIEKLRTNLAIPEEAKYKSIYGMGPAASKVYQVGKGLSIGGYGEAIYQNIVSHKGDTKSTADLERMVIYLGYKFNDWILFNSEIEFNHASSGTGSEVKGEVAAEFAYLDFFLDKKFNVRTGLLLMPMGLINRIHEPPFFFGTHRPMVEQLIIPTTWTEIGLGAFGEIMPNLTYSTYVVNGLNAAGFSSSGIGGGKGEGSNALAQNLAYVGRLDYSPTSIPGLTFGGSGYVGNAGQKQTFSGQKPNVLTQLYEAHVQWKYRGLEFRTLGSWGHIGNAGILSADAGQTIGSQNYGWYSELGYDVLPLFYSDTSQYLAPFFRYEKLNTVAQAPSGYTADPSKNFQVFQVGLQYKPIPNVVIKADYRDFNAKQGNLPNDFNLGFGYIF